MYALITIFYVSLLVMVLMIGLKSREARTGKRTIVSRMGQGTDHFFVSIYLSVKKLISYWNRRTAVALAHWFAYHILFRIRKIYVELKHRALMNPHGRRLINAVRGRGEVRREGASFCLRRIAEGR